MSIYEKILKDFQKEKIKYVLVGGVAFNLLGGFRATADLDILVDMTDENLRKIVKVLKKRGFAIKQPVDPMGIADKKTREEWIKNKHMQAFNFYKGSEKDWEEVDIIIESPVSYAESRKEAVLIKSQGITIPVISIDHLIKMKKKAGRDVDLFDIEKLKEIKRELRKK